MISPRKHYKMNVLFVIGTYSDYGGTEKITTVLANAFCRRGCHAHVAAFRGEVNPGKLGLASDVLCTSLGNDPQRALAKIIRDEKVSVIFNQWCLPYYTTRVINRARKGTGARLISVLHGVPDRSKKVIVAEDALKGAHGFGKILAWLKLQAIHTVIKASIRYVYRRSDAYVVLSKGFISSFRAYTGLRQTPKLHAIGNPITIDPGAYVKNVSREEKSNTVLYVGRLDKENKRVNRIVEVWQSVCSDCPDWGLVLVGDGPHREELQNWVRDNHVDRVTFTGRVKEDPVGYYRRAKIFMLTSDLEGFGLVLLEAMSFGVVPIVYNSYASASEIVDDGVNGLLTQTPFSHEATTKALRTLMENNDLCVKFSEAAVVKAKAFSLTSIIKKWDDLLSSIGVV